VRDDDEDLDDDGPVLRIVEERRPLRQGKIFVDYDERATIGESLEAAYLALDHAFRDIWIQKALESGWTREYWDEADVDELESLTLEASGLVEQAWRALSAVMEAHSAQEEAELGVDDDDVEDSPSS
jgi:hypothetical protein